MFTNILVPVDFTEGNQRAVEIAGSLARPETAVITLLHVIETIDSEDFVEVKDFYTRLEKRASEAMNMLKEPLADSELTIRQKIIYGNRAAQILQFAGEHKIDLIVMSSHKVDPADPVRGWGTISHKVSILSQCPTMLVK